MNDADMEDENGLQWLSNVALEFKGWIFLGVILVITMITYCISLLSLNQEEETGKLRDKYSWQN